jgi:C4-dicarboxylate transporter DctM subunit
MGGLLILLLLIISLLINIPIAISLGIAATWALLATKALPLGFLTQAFFSASDSFPLLAVPFFILAGDIMAHGGISRRLVDFASKIFGGITGSLGIITIFACMIFAAISGSGPATVAAIGGIMIPAMIKDNYDKSFACTLAAAGGSLGPIIPPSISFIIYGIVANVSITDLFLAGILPGIFMGIALMIVVYYYAKKNHYGTITKRASFKELLKSFNDAKWALLVPVIILGGIYSGAVTPTEAAILACDYGLIVGIFVYKELKIKDLPKVFASTSLTSGTVLILVGCATAFGQLLTIEQVPNKVAQLILSISSNKYIVLLLINIFLFIVGMLMETLSAILILAPLLLSIVTPLGITPLHFGIIMVVNLVIGQCTPPVGVNLFVASGIGGIKIEQMVKWLVPLIGSLLIVLMIFTYIPQLSTFLPALLKK